MRIKRAPSGNAWFIVQDTEDGREIIHGCKHDLDEAIEYLTTTWKAAPPTQAERDVLLRDDARVQLRQRLKRMPTTEELDAELNSRRAEKLGRGVTPKSDAPGEKPSERRT